MRLHPRSLRIAAAMLLLIGLAPSARAEGLEGVLTIAGGSEFPLGTPIDYRLRVTNTSAEELQATFEFNIVEVATGRVEEFRRWVELIPAGGEATATGRVPVAHWFGDTGRYKIQAFDYRLGVKLTKRIQVTDPAIPIPTFEDVSAATGAVSELPMFECGTWAAGSAWGDVEGDGDLDLFLPRQGMPAHLFINQGGTFVDEASQRGVAAGSARSLGAVFVDHDNDGDSDLYVTNHGPNFLYDNDGTGHFTERGEASGVAGGGPSQSASWADYDNDGFLDLFVARHVDCIGQAGTSWEDSLYHNEGDGTFTETTDLLHREGSTKGAGFLGVWLDYDADGDLDLYLANDFYGPTPEPNMMWRNDGPGPDGEWVFSEVSRSAQTRITMNSMGVAVGDYDRDLDPDMAISNIYNPRYLVNQGDGTFREAVREASLTMASRDFATRAVSWGVVSADFNLDRWEDVYFPLGGLERRGLPNHLFLNAKDGTFIDVSAATGARDEGIGRSVAVADYDRDGRMDMFLVNQDGPTRFFRNVTPRKRHRWFEVRPIGTTSATDACGARLVLTTAKGKLSRFVMCGSVGLASGQDPYIHFGLGRKNPMRKLVITWPSGTRTVHRDLQPNSVMELREDGT